MNDAASTGSRVYFVNRFYWPDEPATAQLLTDLAEALAERGHAVTVVTSRPANGTGEAHEQRAGVDIVRLGGRRAEGRSLLTKAFSFFMFAIRAHRFLSKTVRAGDVVVLLTDPPLLNTYATPLAIKRGAHVVHWLQDIYPEVAKAVGRGAFGSAFTRRRDRAWQQADACVVPGEDMARFVQTRGVSADTVLVSPNWAPCGSNVVAPQDSEKLRKDWGLAGKFVVLYSGNLGRVHDLDPVLDVAEALRSERDILFLFVGGGAQKRRLQSKAARRGLTNVVFQPSQPRERLAAVLNLGHLHLVTLKEGCEAFVFPSKLYGIIAAGKPTLFIGPKQSEISRTIAGRDIGRCFARNEIDALAQTIRHLRHSPDDCARMSRAALAFSQSNAGFRAAVELWDRLLSGMKLLKPRMAPQP